MYHRAVVQFSRSKGEFVISVYDGPDTTPVAIQSARRDVDILATLRHWRVSPDETKYLPACG